jgi:Tfp pilus assembly protein PilV
MEMVMSHFTGKRMNIRHQRGFSMIEALFSALILGVALLGLAGFHAVALKDGSLTKARSVAANLAHEKLDDLRSFTRLEGDATACGAGTFCFSEIAADAGGQEGGGGLVLPAGTIAGYTDNYSLAWTVTCSAQTAGAALSFGTTCTDASAKMVTVTTSWTDSEGAPQSVSLQGVIYAMDPSKMALAAGPAYSNQLPPKPGYVPVGVPDAVPVPINTGGTQFKESSKPLPEVSQSGSGIEVSFDSVIYSAVTGGYVKDSQEEFSTVGCECQFAGTGSGYTPTRKVWNGVSLEAEVGEEVTKVTGATLGILPPDHCDICCRDHHDRTGDDPKYDPQRPDTDYTAGDHKHYWYKECVSAGNGASTCNDGQKNTSLDSETPLLEVTSGAYLESCRVGRVDGTWRVQQDWQLRKVTILPYDFLLNTTNLSNYVDLVEKVVEKAVKADSSAGSVTLPALGGRDLTLNPGDETVQVLSRAVYVDTIYSKDNPDAVDSAYYTALLAKLSASQSAGNSAWLEYAPFYEANLTLLYDWTSSNTSIAAVTSERIDALVDPANHYYGSFSRGHVTIQSGTTSGESYVTATGRLANSGITGGVNRTSATYVPGVSFGTDYYDNLSTNTLADSIRVYRPASGTMHTLRGKVVKGNTSVNVAEAGTPLSPLTATLTSATGEVIACASFIDTDVNGWYYSCKVPDGYTGTLTITSAGTVYTFDDATSTLFETPVKTVDAGFDLPATIAYGGSAAIRGYVTPAEIPGNPKSDVTVSTTTVSYSGTVGGVATNGTCSKEMVGSPNARLKYTCVVPKGWTGTVTALVNAPGGQHYYLSPGSPASPCASYAASCTMATIPAVLQDIDGTSALATLAQKQQTNVTAAR